MGISSAKRVILLAAALLSGGRWTTATGVDGAGRIVVVPLVMSDAHRESVLTLTNAGPEPLTIDALYVGATGTPLAGPHACKEQGLAPDGSTTVRLRDLCPDLSPKPDAEDFGYLELSSRGDSRLTFFATSTVETDFDRSFGIGGEPIGAFGPAADLGVSGLRALKPGDDESLRCYVGAFHQAKTVIVDLDDSNNNRLATRALSLAPREMQRIDLLPWLGLRATGQTNLRVRFLSFDDAVATAGCAHEHTRTHVMTYQAAQSALATRDAARLRNVYVNHLLDAGPYQIGYPWIHTLTGGRADLKVILSTYLRSNDQVRCYVQPPPAPAFDSSPWLGSRSGIPKGTWSRAATASTTPAFSTRAMPGSTDRGRGGGSRSPSTRTRTRRRRFRGPRCPDSGGCAATARRECRGRWVWTTEATRTISERRRAERRPHVA